MSAKKKTAKVSKKRPDFTPSPELHTWRVVHGGDHYTDVKAEGMWVDEGAVTFMRDKVTIKAFAPGAWNTVELVVPQEPEQ